MCVRCLSCQHACVCVCVCVAVLLSFCASTTCLGLIWRHICGRRCQLEGSEVGALASSLKECMEGEVVVPEVLKEEMGGENNVRAVRLRVDGLLEEEEVNCACVSRCGCVFGPFALVDR